MTFRTLLTLCVVSLDLVGCSFDAPGTADDTPLDDASAYDVGDAAYVREADAFDGKDADGEVAFDGDACATDAPCDDTTEPCKDVIASCVGGVPKCTVVGPRPNGTPCGTNAVCNGGVCTVCTSGAACTPTATCRSGATDCSSGTSTCVVTGNAPDGTACAAGRSCKSGACTCNAPTAECAGKCVDLTSDPASCGACGTVCSTLGCKGGACQSYGGSFEVGCNAASCTGGPPCIVGNDRTGACSCPPGSIGVGTDAFKTELDVNYVGICFASPLPKNADFGGTYLVKDFIAGCNTAAATPLPATGCDVTNPLTGACSCPAGFTPLGIRALSYCDDGTAKTDGAWLYYCWNATAPQISFGGVYEVRDDGACAVGNAATGACSCPTGATAHTYRVFIDVPSVMGATIFVCDR